MNKLLMSLELLLNSLRDRVPFPTMSAILKLSDLPVSRGAKNTVDRILKEVSEGKKDYSSELEKLNDFYSDHLLICEKAVQLFPVDRERINKIIKLLKTHKIEKSDFRDSYPFPLSEDKLRATNSELSLVKIVESDENLNLIFCSKRFFTERIEINTFDLSPATKKELDTYDELFGIKNYFRQFFDVVVLWKHKPHIEVRVDVARNISFQDRKKYTLEIAGQFNNLIERLLGIPSVLKAPVNFFPLIKKLYDKKGEGKVGELAFTTTQGSIKFERMRLGSVDLRDEIYHKAGKAAVKDIDPYRLAILWDSPISESLDIKNQLELFLQGHCRDLSAGKQILEDIIIRKCSCQEDYKFVFEKINEYLKDDG